MRQVFRWAAVLAALFVLPFAAAQAQGDRPFVVATPIEPDTTDASKTRLPPLVYPTLTNINEPLIDVGPDGNPKPGLATWTIQNDGRAVEFKIRPGVKFHSGDPLTAADLKFSHERTAEKNLFYRRQTAKVERVEVVDDLTARFIFKEPDPTFLRARPMLVFSKAYFDKVGEDAFGAKPVGTGPYRFVEHRSGEHLDLAANDDYWGGAPAVKRARFVFIKDDEARVAKLRSGEADIIMHAPYTAIANLQKAGFKTTAVPVHPTLAIYFHTKNSKAPWHDVRVRRAISHAIDGDAIVKTLLMGVPNRFAALGPGEIGHDPALKPPAFDAAQARKLLAEAGHAKGFVMPMYYSVGSYAGIRETAEAIALYLRPLGIEVKLEAKDQLQSVEMLRTLHKDANAMMVGLHPLTIASTPEPSHSLGLSFSTKSPFSLHTNTEFDRYQEEALRTLDNAKRGELVNKAVRVLVDDVIYIPMWSANSMYAMRSQVQFTGIPRTAAGPWMRLQDVRVNAR